MRTGAFSLTAAFRWSAILHRREGELRRGGLRALLAGQPDNPAIAGGAVGALYASGDLDDAELVRLVGGHLELHGPAFLRGLLRTHRACLWQVRPLLEELTRQLCDWDHQYFLGALPDLRLACADLSARESDLVARTVAALVGARAAPNLLVGGATQDDLLLGAVLDARLAGLLARDGLDRLTSDE